MTTTEDFVLNKIMENAYTKKIDSDGEKNVIFFEKEWGDASNSTDAARESVTTDDYLLVTPGTYSFRYNISYPKVGSAGTTGRYYSAYMKIYVNDELAATTSTITVYASTSKVSTAYGGVLISIGKPFTKVRAEIIPAGAGNDSGTTSSDFMYCGMNCNGYVVDNLSKSYYCWEVK